MTEFITLDVLSYNLQNHCQHMIEEIQKRLSLKPSQIEMKVICQLINSLVKFLKTGNLSDLPNTPEYYDGRFLHQYDLKTFNQRKDADIKTLTDKNSALENQLRNTNQKLIDNEKLRNNLVKERDAFKNCLTTNQENENNMVEQFIQKENFYIQRISDLEDQVERLKIEKKLSEEKGQRMNETIHQLEQRLRGVQKPNQDQSNQLFYDQQDLFRKNEELVRKYQAILAGQSRNEEQPNFEVQGVRASNIEEDPQEEEESLKKVIGRMLTEMPTGCALLAITTGLFVVKIIYY